MVRGAIGSAIARGGGGKDQRGGRGKRGGRGGKESEGEQNDREYGRGAGWCVLLK